MKEFTNSDPRKGSVLIRAPRRRKPIPPEQRRRCSLCGEVARKYGLCERHAGYRYQWWRKARSYLEELGVLGQVEWWVAVDLRANYLLLRRGERMAGVGFLRVPRQGRWSRWRMAHRRQEVIEALKELYAGEPVDEVRLQLWWGGGQEGAREWAEAIERYRELYRLPVLATGRASSASVNRQQRLSRAPHPGERLR